MAELGMKKQVDLARAAGVSEATVGRIIYENAAFERDILASVESALELPARTLVGDLGKVAEQANERSTWSHPIAAELNRMLNPESPLTDADREDIRKFVDRFIDSYRVTMRKSRRTA